MSNSKIRLKIGIDFALPLSQEEEEQQQQHKPHLNLPKKQTFLKLGDLDNNS